MQAIILAGGLATRLRPLTQKIPKSMIPFNGRPFLAHLLELLRNNEINDILLCTGYLGNQIKDYLGNGGDLGMRVRYSEEKGVLMGTGGALKLAENLLDEHFFVINGDTYLPINYGEVKRFFLESEKMGLMVVYDNREDTGVKNNVALGPNLTVTKYDKKGIHHGLKYVEAGVSIFKRDIISLIERGRPVSLEKSIYPTLIEQGKLAAYITDQRFYDIGTTEGLKEFEMFLERSLNR